MCIYTYVYIDIHVPVYLYITYTYVHIYIYIYIYIYISISICVNAHYIINAIHQYSGRSERRTSINTLIITSMNMFINIMPVTHINKCNLLMLRNLKDIDTHIS